MDETKEDSIIPKQVLNIPFPILSQTFSGKVSGKPKHKT